MCLGVCSQLVFFAGTYGDCDDRPWDDPDAKYESDYWYSSSATHTFSGCEVDSRGDWNVVCVALQLKCDNDNGYKCDFTLNDFTVNNDGIDAPPPHKMVGPTGNQTKFVFPIKAK